jgi:hypothetical protein
VEKWKISQKMEDFAGKISVGLHLMVQYLSGANSNIQTNQQQLK